MKHIYFRFLFMCLALTLLGSGVNAATTYQYSGQNFDSFQNGAVTGEYTSAMSVTGSFTVDAPLTSTSLTDISDDVLSYSFTDGRSTLTELNSSITILVAVDGGGQITSWSAVVTSTDIIPPFLPVGSQLLAITTENASTVSDQGEIWECFSSSPFGGGCGFFDVDWGTNSNLPGTWSVVPVPGSIWLFGSAFAFFGWIRKKLV